MDRETLIERLAEDLEDSLLADRKFRAMFCSDHFRRLSDEDLRQAAHDAGLED